MKKCGQVGCSAIAEYVFSWPSAPNSVVCSEHVGKVNELALAMGLGSIVERIEETYQLKTLLGFTIGEASMCWNPVPSGVFDSSHACAVLDRAMLGLYELLKEEGA